MALRSSRRFISQANVKSGMMVEFKYTKKDSTTSSYMIMVIDPDRNGHLHGILINDLTDAQIVEFSKEIGENFTYDLTKKNTPIVDLQSDAAYQRYKTSTLSNNRKYRTFLLSRMKDVRQILIGEIK